MCLDRYRDQKAANDYNLYRHSGLDPESGGSYKDHLYFLIAGMTNYVVCLVSPPTLYQSSENSFLNLSQRFRFCRAVDRGDMRLRKFACRYIESLFNHCFNLSDQRQRIHVMLF